MSVEEAKQVLETAINSSLQKGVFNLPEIVQVISALDTLYNAVETEQNKN
jgi:hypothetical protein